MTTADLILSAGTLALAAARKADATGNPELCRVLTNLALELCDLSGEEADRLAGIDRLGLALAFSAGEPWSAQGAA